jgi:phage terminase small subunit
MSRPQAKKLVGRMQRFVECYASTGDGGESVLRAGYNCKDRNTAQVQACRLLKKPHVVAALKALTAKTTTKAIATAQDRQTFWSQIMNNEKEDTNTRLRASELLGKAHGDFVSMALVTPPGASTIAATDGDQLSVVTIYLPANGRELNSNG